MLGVLQQRNWLAGMILVCGAMLALLVRFQFAWTAQLSESQKASMRNSLSNSMQLLRQEAQREIQVLLTTFRFDPQTDPGQLGDWGAERYERWLQATMYPALLGRLVAYSSRDTGPELEELALGEARVVDATWDAKLRRLRSDIEGSEPLVASQRSPRPASWTYFPRLEAFARAMPERTGPPVRRNPRSQVAPSKYLILVLEFEPVLSEAVQRLFSASNGERLYDVALVTKPDRRFIFRSAPGLDWAWYKAADARLNLQLLNRPRPTAPRRTAGPRRPAPGFGRGRSGRPGGATPAFGPPFGRPFPGPARQIAAFTTAREYTGIEVVASHVSGSLELAVQERRRKDLAIGLGVLFVLAGAMALVLVSARRASQLASMQMAFMAGITHELRTPLSAICSIGDNLADGVVGAGTQARRYGELIQEQGRRLGGMIEQTLQFAATAPGRRRFDLKPLDLQESVGTALARAAPSIEEAGFAVERVDAAELPMALADRNALQQILANLLSNAVKYGGPARWVEVETATSRKHPRQVLVRVRDRGPGIPPADAARIFEAFYRGESAARSQAHGSGLGLKLARDLARGMGGDVSVQSGPDLGGSVFTIHLRASAQAKAQAKA